MWTEDLLGAGNGASFCGYNTDVTGVAPVPSTPAKGQSSTRHVTGVPGSQAGAGKTAGGQERPRRQRQKACGLQWACVIQHGALHVPGTGSRQRDPSLSLCCLLAFGRVPWALWPPRPYPALPPQARFLTCKMTTAVITNCRARPSKKITRSHELESYVA